LSNINVSENSTIYCAHATLRSGMKTGSTRKPE